MIYVLRGLRISELNFHDCKIFKYKLNENFVFWQVHPNCRTSFSNFSIIVMVFDFKTTLISRMNESNERNNR